MSDRFSRLSALFASVRDMLVNLAAVFAVFGTLYGYLRDFFVWAIEKLGNLSRSPLLAASVVFVAIIGAAALGGGGIAYLSQGGSIQLFQGLVAAAFFLALGRITRYLTVTLRKETSDAIGTSPIARGIISAGNLIASGLVTLAVFG